MLLSLCLTEVLLLLWVAVGLRRCAEASSQTDHALFSIQITKVASCGSCSTQQGQTKTQEIKFALSGAFQAQGCAVHVEKVWFGKIEDEQGGLEAA